jgi:large subunit ribosomal protein L6
MSRIGKQIFIIKAGTTVSLTGNTFSVKGKNGTINKELDLNIIDVKIDGQEISLSPRRNDKFARSLWGTYGAHVKNMLAGVETVFERILIVEGVGYKWEIAGKQVKLALGFSHPIVMEIPEGLKVEIDKLTMKISGMDKGVVGQFAKNLRALKEPEPYKGKGIRYSDEVIRRKQGKRST